MDLMYENYYLPTFTGDESQNELAEKLNALGSAIEKLQRTMNANFCNTETIISRQKEIFTKVQMQKILQILQNYKYIDISEDEFMRLLEE